MPYFHCAFCCPFRTFPGKVHTAVPHLRIMISACLPLISACLELALFCLSLQHDIHRELKQAETGSIIYISLHGCARVFAASHLSSPEGRNYSENIARIRLVSKFTVAIDKLHEMCIVKI